MSNPYDRANPFNTGTRADTFGIRPDLFKELQAVAPKKETIDHLVESEKEMAGRLDLLDPIMDFGQSYMPTGIGFSGTGRLPFRAQRGPAKGVRVENNGMRLLGAGAWQITCEVRPSWISIQGHDITYRIYCYDPQGSLYTYQEFIDLTSSSTHSVSFGADFVVPDPNYFVAVVVYDIALGRKHVGGYAATRLVAKRWSSQFINPPTGGASEVVD
ncbi:hypothetical protein [Corynebacterium stationis]|uniref:hypothetical protein n=1 Tax=Corynebacterium stationis TaxID=1705 RepID=UPI00263BA989|nr:hypothetical protein [Corynebacterium stationis]